ncbi:MAG: GH92 family glycosyl hydrolase [Bacteroidales bacterium]|nr:GH92 family glycosyl hydrolase [Bacteroidales bacterium]
MINSAFIIALALVTSYVNPFVGTDAHGHTFPGACAPFGMVQLSPDTRPKSGDWDGCSGYHYSDTLIYGFSHTHLSGTGCDDWCDILLTPGGRPSRFSHRREKASPGYYEVWLADTKVKARLAAGRRVAMHEYSFSGKDDPVISLDLRHRDPLDSFAIHYGPGWISGVRVSSSWARGQHVYFYMEFSSPAECTLSDDGRKAVLRFGERKITVRTAISSVSEDGAKANLYSEYPESLRQLKCSTARRWELYMSKLKCPWSDVERRRRFYTALYHTGIHPSLYSDADGRYRGMDGRIHKAEGWERYTVFSTWDTFRGEHPLLFEIEPVRSMDFIKSMISVYEENGKLPVWELSGWETDCMIGYNSAPVIADAVARGLTGFDVPKAFEALLASSLRPEYGMDSFRSNGLVLADDEHESVSKTLEYAYDDWCVAQVAAYLGRTEEYERYMRSSQYWKNVFDPASGFMRARLNGRWFSPFDPREVNNNYTEANSWQYSFFVPHDVPGLTEALGGTEALEARLDALFSAPEGNTGRTQADITGCIGQYAQGNEPSHHIPYLYAFTKHPEKAQSTVTKILETLYSSAPDGLCGNDDCGQMSAWYVLGALGRYPLCPGAGISVTGMPQVEPIVVNPVFEMDGDIFAGSMEVAIRGEGNVMYRIGEEEFRPYEGPFTLERACTMEAYSIKDGRRSFTTRSTVHRIQSDRDIQILSRCSSQYTAGGPEGLIDGRRGGINWRTGGWQGYQAADFRAVVDLREPRELHCLGAGFCQDARSWIWMPREVLFEVSSDGVGYTTVAKIKTTVPERDMVVRIWDCETPVECTARYIRVSASNIGTIPEWHPGAGYPGFIFIDEIWAY